MQSQSLTKLASVGLLLLVACGGPNKALISQSEINSAQQNGNLQVLYQKTESIINESRGSSKQEAIELRSKIGKLLVDEQTAKITPVLDKAENNLEDSTRADLLLVDENVEEMKSWSETDYARYKARVSPLLASINQKISEIYASANEASIAQVERILRLEKAAKFAGPGQPESLQYEDEFSEAVKLFLYQGSDALSKKLFSTSLTAAQKGLLIDPGNIKFESMLSQSQAGLFEKEFQYALENGKPESAYQSLLKVADEPIFLQLKKSMKSSIELLMGYFAGAGAKATVANDLNAAYENFSKGRVIQEKMGVVQRGFTQETSFIKKVMQRAQNKAIGDGERYALLRVVMDMMPNYPTASAEFNKAQQAVSNRAMTKLAINEFKEVKSSDPVASSVGRRISRKLEKILFDQLGSELSIVTDTSLESQADYQGLALKIQGEVLQAAIETSVNQGQRSQNVQVDELKTETEAYSEWKERKRGEAPTRYSVKPVIEEVVLTVEHIRKLAIAEVAYRIVEPASNQVLMTDSFVKQEEFSGESINEYQKGDFLQPYVRADLPSDINIMDTLASELAQKLGEKLGGYLQKPEQVFYQKHKDALAQANSKAAIELLANAQAIAASKGLDVSAWNSELNKLALN